MRREPKLLGYSSCLVYYLLIDTIFTTLFLSGTISGEDDEDEEDEDSSLLSSYGIYGIY